jgi:hypothetical protein
VFTTVIQVGRLYEHRLTSIDSDDEIAAVKARAIDVMRGSPGKVVVCADFRQLRFLKVELVDRYIDMLRVLSPNVERSGMLITPDQAVFNLQLGRMVRETGFPNRKVFRDAHELQHWLGEVLTLEERGRMASFLEAGAAPR